MPPQKPKGGKGAMFLMGLIGVIVGACLSVGILSVATHGFSFSGSIDGASGGVASGSSSGTFTITPPTEESSLPEVVAAKVMPSVVNIDVYNTAMSNPLNDFFGNGPNGGSGSSGDTGDPTMEKTGLGSGVILTSDGYILTNYHVVEGGSQFMVSLGDSQVEGKVVGSDPPSDLAVLKVDATNLIPIEVGDSDKAVVGDWVMAVGSPYGLEKSVSTGIVSALYRSTTMQTQEGVNIYANLIQTDAAINPGNSGGALVNSEGQLIGINTLISSTTGSYSGIGFALPSNFTMNVAEQIMQGKPVQHPFLGVTLVSVSAANAGQLKTNATSGAYIETIQPGSPAETAGLKAGDVITSIEGHTINTSTEAIIQIRSCEVGDKIKVIVDRDGSAVNLEVVLGATSDD
jgi:putative serine protease PepD